MMEGACAAVAAIQNGQGLVARAIECLQRREAYDAIQPEAWIYRTPRDAFLEAAAGIEKRLRAGDALPLAGVVFAIKDNIDWRGAPTSAACPTFAYQPARSAFVVERLEAMGALCLGKTNLDQFATGLVGARSPHGACGCVFNRAYVSGGSSSGSAVLVAAGVVDVALGTDTAGSGRVPAAFNNLIGLKPTKGRYSTSGVVPACRSLDCVSLFARSLEDAALMDSALAAFDPEDPFAREGVAAPGAMKRVGVPREADLDFDGDDEAQRLFARAVQRLERAGVDLIEIDIAPLIACAKLLYEGPWLAERTAALEPLLRDNPQAIHAVVRAIVEKGSGMSAVDAFRGLYALQAHAREAQALWRVVDALVLPTAPTLPSLQAVRADPIARNAVLGRYTNFVNLLDLAALAAPAGFLRDRGGFGVTFIGPAWSDAKLMALARAFSEVEPMAETPPLDLSPRAPEILLAVVGAHLHGMPLHGQLESRHARLVRACATAPAYKLYAMANSTPPKPALVHVGAGGASIAVEVYALDVAAFGAFVAEVPAPLAIGTVTLDDGAEVKGFVAEPRALEGATDVTSFGGWRAYMASKKG